MKRSKATQAFPTGSLRAIKNQVLDWAAAQSGPFLFLDSNDWPHDRHARYELLAGIGALPGREGDSRPETWIGGLPEKAGDDWLFGHLSYDLRTETEPSLNNDLPALSGFPPAHFFRPAMVCYIRKGSSELAVESAGPDAAAVLDVLLSTVPGRPVLPVLHFTQAFSKEDYLAAVRRIQEHIRLGDCYELNFCAAAYTPAMLNRPQDAFTALCGQSPMPMAACYRLGPDWLLCASPERYLQKESGILRSQPIKGTARRVDGEQHNGLAAVPKEQAEHRMIVDLVRNDLARCCKPGSIAVDELMGLYSFPRVHHLISTVSGCLREELSLQDAIRATFPMGSMTGMPKVKVMQLTEQYERHRRGLFSGSVGYVSPGGDADFNVVIRSLFYNEDTRLLSYQTGGAITLDSDAAAEWEERLLKAEGMEKIFAGG